MKNNLLKYYIATFYFASTFVLLAQGTDDDNGKLEDNDPLPIDDYLWVLVALGLMFVFFKYRAMAQQKKI